MKIIGINTSPRENSNVRTALVKALEAAENKGAETEIFDTNTMNIGGCQADNFCKSHEGKCPVNDDMQKIYRAIEEADSVILASPIYFFDVNAQAKLVIDRLYAYFQFPFVETYGNKKFSMITSQGTEDENAFMDVINVQRKGFELLGFEVKDLLVLTGKNIPGSINEDEDSLAKAAELGENLVE